MEDKKFKEPSAIAPPATEISGGSSSAGLIERIKVLIDQPLSDPSLQRELLRCRELAESGSTGNEES